jgi:hypothetical protein
VLRRSSLTAVMRCPVWVVWAVSAVRLDRRSELTAVVYGGGEQEIRWVIRWVIRTAVHIHSWLASLRVLRRSSITAADLGFFGLSPVMLWVCCGY